MIRSEWVMFLQSIFLAEIIFLSASGSQLQLTNPESSLLSAEMLFEQICFVNNTMGLFQKLISFIRSYLINNSVFTTRS